MTPNIYPGWSLFHKNLLRPKQAKWLPHMHGLCSQNLRRGRLSLRSALPHYIAGPVGGWGSPQEASRPGGPRACPLALAGAKL